MPNYVFRINARGGAPYEAEGNGWSLHEARRNVARREGVDLSEVGFAREIREERSRGGHAEESQGSGGGIHLSSEATPWIAGIIFCFWLFFAFTPWILMLLGGIGGFWIVEKWTGQSLDEYLEEGESGNTKLLVAFFLSIALASFGFYKGDEIKRGFDKQINQPQPAMQRGLNDGKTTRDLSSSERTSEPATEATRSTDTQVDSKGEKDENGTTPSTGGIPASNGTSSLDASTDRTLTITNQTQAGDSPIGADQLDPSCKTGISGGCGRNTDLKSE